MKRNVVREICDHCWLTQQDLASVSTIKLQRIRDISSGRVDGFKSDDIALLVEKLHLNANWLTTGEGEVFEYGFSRNHHSFVMSIIERMIKLVGQSINQDSYDELLNLERGTTSGWINNKIIPYWFLDKFAEENKVPVDYLLYGSIEHYQSHKLFIEQESAAYPLESENAQPIAQLTPRELALLDDFRALSDNEKNAAETMLRAITKSKMKKA